MVDLRTRHPKEDCMKKFRQIASLLAPAILVTGCFLIPAAKAADNVDSVQISQLLTEAKVEAAELKHDSAQMEAFTGSKLHWESYARRVEMIKEHVNNTGKLLARMKEVESTGAPWQQHAIQQIELFLKEMADNTTATIEHLNNNRDKIHFQAFRDYVKENYELASDLESLVRDFANYGEAKAKAERLSDKRVIPD
jgi:hypothetical protein